MGKISEKKGYDVLGDPALNKSTGFSKEERETLYLRGLLPTAVCSMEVQTNRVLENVRRKAFEIEGYNFLMALLERNERLFYRTLIENIKELMPLIYTPTVGEACKEFAHIFRKPRGLYITPEDKGQVGRIMDNWPESDVRVIVVTDGERILGLGDLGANGMGIPIGKLALYVACGGIQPHQCMPVMLDVGTNNEALRDDPLYLGFNSGRIDQAAYDELVEEFVMAVQDKFPKALIQFEDFLTPNAYRFLEEYKNRVLCFNDDIQGTAAMALAGVKASTKISGLDFKNLRIMFLGAGSAATGIGDLMTKALVAEGLSPKQAKERLWFVDMDGLVVKGRDRLAPHNLPYAHEHPHFSFIEAIEKIRPHVLIGATGAPGTFTEEAVKLMAKINERPAIFALSNPTSRAECTAEQAYEWSKGKAIFASGSPFPAYTINDQEMHSSQGNNAYIFPGIGLGAVVSGATRICDEMFLTAADTLAGLVSEAEFEKGSVYPALDQIRDVSLAIAINVANSAYAYGLTKNDRPENVRQAIEAYMFNPEY